MLPRVMILAGGLGTRLSSVVKDVPKPMAPISGKPFLEYQIEFLRNQGFTKFTLLTGYLSEVIEAHFGNGELFGVEIEYSKEVTPLGTGGAIRQAFERTTDETALVLNGDSLFATDYTRFVRLSNTPASLALVFSTDLSRYGSVVIDSDFKITSFAEKSASAGDGYINAGVYFITRKILERLPEGKSSIEKELFEPLSREGVLFGIPCGGKFVDIGTPESFSWSQTHLPGWLRQIPKPALFLDRDGIVVEFVDYLHKPEEVRIVPETAELIREANSKGWPVIVLTNQSGVGRGRFTEDQCNATNFHIQKELSKLGAKIDSWQCCFDHPTEGKDQFKRNSLRRKPNPGMALEACEKFAIDLSRSLMIGDNSTDQLHLPDLRTILVKGNYNLDPIRKSTQVAVDFKEVLKKGQVAFLKH